ncbi:hypothetical protein FACS1894102_4170 [Spirochaetia bacterium]|nr:hypothetical protein FACS1894102_4170 [Spirochaetia bacterium]
MSNIQKAFSHGKAFIGFVTGGDPSCEKTVEFVLAMERAGASLIEIGIPFSDPIAEGPVIQEANVRALKNGANVAKMFKIVENVRKVSDVPIVFLTYFNPVFRYGCSESENVARKTESGAQFCPAPDTVADECIGDESGADPISGSSTGSTVGGSGRPVLRSGVRGAPPHINFPASTEPFFRACMTAGVDGVIIPDLPFEEACEVKADAAKCGVDIISMIAPTSSQGGAKKTTDGGETESRAACIAKSASGFVYVVSSMGVTGVRANIETDLTALVQAVKSNGDVPAAVGFGVNTPKQAGEIAKIADGVIVGSAIVKICAGYGVDAAPHIESYVREMVAQVVGN